MSKRLVLLVSGLLIIIGCQENKEIKRVIRPVRTEQVFSTGAERIRTFAGVVQAGTESKMSFKVSGTVERIYVEIGSKVRAGHTLAELDPTDYEIQVRQAENARDQARAAEIQAEAQYERVRQLYENNSASKSDLEAARAAYQSAHEQDNITKKRRKLARNQLEYTKLKAPVAGAISSVRIEQNENIQMGQHAFVLTSGSDLEVRIAMPEILIAQIREGDNVSVTLDAVGGKVFDAKVTEVGIASTQYATTYPVTVKLLKVDPDIRPGMAAEVSFSFRATREQESFVVPAHSVSEDRLGRFVFVVEPADSGLGIVHKKPVEVGELLPDGLEILEGLTDGDHLVTAGVSKITDSLTVRFTQSGD